MFTKFCRNKLFSKIIAAAASLSFMLTSQIQKEISQTEAFIDQF